MINCLKQAKLPYKKTKIGKRSEGEKHKNGRNIYNCMGCLQISYLHRHPVFYYYSLGGQHIGGIDINVDKKGKIVDFS